METIKINYAGCSIDNLKNDYNGDIGNHRVNFKFKNMYDIEFFVEISSVMTYRTKSMTTGSDLKKRIETSSANGLHVQVYAMYTEVIRGCTGQWFNHETEKTVLDFLERDDLSRPVHTWKHALWHVWRATGVKIDLIDHETLAIMED
jgi:hypothetical protein